MLDATLKSQLKTYLERVTQPIEIVASLDDGAKSRELHDLLVEIASLSTLITLSADGTDARRPSFSLSRPGAGADGKGISLRFAGIPMGHEFTSLVLALLQVGGHPSKASAEVIEQIQALEGEFTFETYSAVVPELPGRGPGVEPDGRAQPQRAPRGHRRRAVPG